jgi:hypothetical protein
MYILMKSVTSDIELHPKEVLSSPDDMVSVNSGVKTLENWKRKNRKFHQTMHSSFVTSISLLSFATRSRLVIEFTDVSKGHYSFSRME